MRTLIPFNQAGSAAHVVLSDNSISIKYTTMRRQERERERERRTRRDHAMHHSRPTLIFPLTAKALQKCALLTRSVNSRQRLFNFAVSRSAALRPRSGVGMGTAPFWYRISLLQIEADDSLVLIVFTGGTT